MASKTGYSKLQIALHWAIAVLIVAAYWISDGMGRILGARIRDGQTGLEGGTVHTWIGGTVFFLILIRLVVRLRQGAPEAHGSAPMVLAAKLGHVVLYALMILVPAAGAAAWYWHIREAGDVHELLVNALMLVALGHAAMAIYHQFVKKDGTLTRMIRSA